MKQALIVLAVAVLATWAGIFYQNAKWETLRIKCNDAYNTRQALPEDDGDSTISFNDDGIDAASTSDQVKFLLAENKTTRTQVNKLTSLMGCYFDK